MSVAGNIMRYMIVLFTGIPLYSLAILVWIISKKASWHIVVSCNKFFLRLFNISLDIDITADISELLKGGVIVGLNQESILEPMIGIAASPVPVKSFFNLEYALIPFIGWMSGLLGYVIIRQWPAQSKRKLLKAVSYLRKGGHVYLSIEGRRTKDGSLGAYKKGPVVLAIQAGASIIPIIFIGSGKCMPYGSWMIEPGIITVKILSPIPTRNMTYDDRDMLVARLRTLALEEFAKVKP